MSNDKNFRISILIVTFFLLFSLFPSMLTAQPTEPDDPIQVIVRFDPNYISTQKNQFDLLSGMGLKLQKSFKTIPAAAMALTFDEIQVLSKHPAISYIEPDYPVHALHQVVPWGISSVLGEQPYPFVIWETTQGENIGVAVLDTGIDENHRDLPPLAGGVTTVDATHWGLDQNGHGTHVAGIIAAQNNSYDVVGLAPNVNLYAVKVLNHDGDGSVSNIIAGIEWAMEQNIPIINMSLGGYGYSETLEEVCQNAFDAGHLLIAAAGNKGNTSGTGDNVTYPAKFDSVIAVAASTENNSRASFSSTGPAVELIAPGSNIISTSPDKRLAADLIYNNLNYQVRALLGSEVGTVNAPIIDCGLALSIEDVEAALEDASHSPEDKWIALIDRDGIVPFTTKVSNVLENQASAAIIINNDTETPDNPGDFSLFDESFEELIWIPTVSVSYNSGILIRSEELGIAFVEVYSQYYQNNEGTSMAAPHVSAAAALLWSQKQTIANTEIRRYLNEGAVDLGLEQTQQGYGFLRADLSLSLLMDDFPPYEPKLLTLDNFSATDKTYDGTNAVIASSFNDDRDQGDDITFTYQAYFDSKDAGLNKTVTFSNIAISGGLDKDKYMLATVDGSATASINKAPLSVTAVASGIIYGDPEPSINLVFEEFVREDTEAELDDINFAVGTNYTQFDPVGTYNTYISLGAAVDQNYQFTPLKTSSFFVVPKEITIAGTFTVKDKVYDGSRAAETMSNILSLLGILGDDEVTLANIQALFIDSAVGENKLVSITGASLTGKDASNYTLMLDGAPTATASITAAPVVGGGGGGGGGGGSIAVLPPTPPPPEKPTLPVFFDGARYEDLVYTENKTLGDQKAISLYFDMEKTKEFLAAVSLEENGKTLSFPVRETAEIIELELPVALAQAFAEKELLLSLEAQWGSYTVPAEQVKLERLADLLKKDISPEKTHIKIELKKLPAEEAQNINQLLENNNLIPITSPISTQILCFDGFTTTPMEAFSEYVQRTIYLPEDIIPKQGTTGLWVDKEMLIRPVPMFVQEKDGYRSAILKSFTNSTYTVAHNSVTVPNSSTHWSGSAAANMAAKLVIPQPELFVPEGLITRGEFAAYITRALGLYEKQKNTTGFFSDVSPADPLAVAIASAVQYDIIRGYPDGTFRPENKISRQEAMLMYARAMDIVGLPELDNERIVQFSDQYLVADWAYEGVRKALGSHVFNGTGPNTIAPLHTFKFAEAVTAIQNLLINSGLAN